MAYVLDFRGEEVGQCSGTVVAPNLILTAAHCAEDVQTGVANEASGYRVMTGSLDWAAPEAGAQVASVSRVIVCSCFDRQTLVGDVALLELSTPTTAPVVKLAASPHAGAAALFAGWGETQPKPEVAVEHLQWAPTEVQGARSCEREASPFAPASEICVVDSPRRQTGICHGDSGGPLLLREPNAVGGMVQIGVASHGYGECATTSPAVFTRVDAVSSWIEAWARALVPAPPGMASASADAVPAPALAGIAVARSLSIKNGIVSLGLGCDGEGGVCAGAADATVTLRVTLRARLGALKRTSTRVRELRLIGARFTIAPGWSTVVRSSLSSQMRTLLAHLGDAPIEVTLAGRGVAAQVVALVGR